MQPIQVTIDSSSYGNGRILVADETGDDYSKGRVFVFAAGSNGNVSPIATITRVDNPRGVATDADGHIYVSSVTNNAIQEFKKDANGNATPLFTIKGSYTELYNPENLYVRNL